MVRCLVGLAALLGSLVGPSGVAVGQTVSDGALGTPAGVTVDLASPSHNRRANFGRAMSQASFQMPFPCGEVWGASTYGGHNAVDWNVIGAGNGDTGRRVEAGSGGVVTTAGSASDGYGNRVMVDHGNGWSSLYAHLQSITVFVGQSVSQTTQIGTVGATGAVSGAHLHWEQRLNGARQYPLYANGSVISPAPSPDGNAYTSHNCPVAPPPPDNDGDGVPDSADQCPFMPGRATGHGCEANADADGNGHSDLVVANGSTLRLLGWNGAPGFQVATQQSFGRVPWGAMGDVDGNGHTDLVVSTGQKLKVLGWNGAPGFQVATRQSFGPLSWGAMGDVDGNGHDDLVAFDGSTLRVLGWNGAPGFQVATRQPFGPLRWAGMGDVDGNGHDDLVVFDGATLRLLGWNGAPGFQVATQQSFGRVVWAAMGDVDANGHSDLIVYNGRKLKVYGWNGAPGFQVATRQSFGPLSWGAMGDVDGNGHDDLVAFDGSTLRVLGWNGAPGFQVATQQSFEPFSWASGSFAGSNGAH